MRLAFIIDHLSTDLAGTEHQVAMMIRGLGSYFDVDLISLRDSAWLQGPGASLPCRVRAFQIDNFRRPQTYRDILALRGYLREIRPDDFHTFFPVSNIIGVLCARLAGVGATVASRRDYGEWMSPRYLAATRFANRFVSRIVTNSHEVKRLTERVERFPGERIEVIYNGIAVDSFKRGAPRLELRRELGIGDGQRVVGLVANYRPMKRHATLVRAAAAIRARRDDVDFVLVGNNVVRDDLKSEIERLVADTGLGARVHFAHAAGNVRDYLSIFDVGVNCSEGEGLSNAIMEYMASEVPCVVSSSGGNPDLITDDVHGLCFPLDDHHALAAAIERLLDDEPACRRYARAALDKVRREMSTEALIDRFRGFYEGLRTPQPAARLASG